MRARSQEIGGHRAHPSFGVGRCIAVQEERSEAKEQARWTSAQARGHKEGGGLGSAGGRRRLAEPGGGKASRAARAGLWVWLTRGGCCDSVSPRNWPVATYAIGPLQTAIGPLQPVRGPDSERKTTPREPKRDVYTRFAAWVSCSGGLLDLSPCCSTY